MNLNLIYYFIKLTNIFEVKLRIMTRPDKAPKERKGKDE